MTSYKALYGRDPPKIFATLATPAKLPEVRELILERDALIRSLKRRLAKTQEMMSAVANRHRRDVEYKVGDKVLLRLQPYRQLSVGRPISVKLSRRYYGPFKVTERIGAVAYRLRLPVESRIHDVFHVSLLRPFVRLLSDVQPELLPAKFSRSRSLDVPIRAAESRTVLVQGVPQEQWCVFWSSHPTSNATWEPKEELLRHFPHLCLEDKAVSKERGVDTDLGSDPQTMAEDDHEESIQDNEARGNEEEGDELQGSEEEQSGRGEEEAQSIAKDRPKRNTCPPSRWKDFITK